MTPGFYSSGGCLKRWDLKLESDMWNQDEAT
jgi:hypothetical protein